MERSIGVKFEGTAKQYVYLTSLLFDVGDVAIVKVGGTYKLTRVTSIKTVADKSHVTYKWVKGMIDSRTGSIFKELGYNTQAYNPSSEDGITNGMINDVIGLIKEKDMGSETGFNEHTFFNGEDMSNKDDKYILNILLKAKAEIDDYKRINDLVKSKKVSKRIKVLKGDFKRLHKYFESCNE